MSDNTANNNNPTVALFDFDGTLTSRDTLPLYILHATGLFGFLRTVIRLLPALLVLASNHWYSKGDIDAVETKMKLLQNCFKGKTIEQVNATAQRFIKKINRILNSDIYDIMCSHLTKGNKVVIVSASPRVWIEPWAKSVGDIEVIATEIEVVDGRYTGRFQGENCNGYEKLNRISQRYPRSQYNLIAYGDSVHDGAMLMYAQTAYMYIGEDLYRLHGE